MKEFTYALTDPAGFHARPATKMVQEASKYKSEIAIKLGDKTANGKRIFSILGLGAKQGSAVTFSFNGEDEEEAAKAIEAFVKANM